MKHHTSKLICTAGAVAAMLSLAASSAQAGHVYAGLIDSNGGGLGTGDALSFVVNTGTAGGAVVTGASQGIQAMTPVLVGAQSGLYLSSDISFTALAGTGRIWNGNGVTGTAYRAESLYAANAGAFITLLMTNVTGPTGGQFSFWDDEFSTVAPQVTFTIGGATGGNSTFNLTDRTLIIGNGTTPLLVNPNTGVPYSFADYAPTTNGLSAGFTWNDADGSGPSTTVTDPYGHLHGRSWTASVEGTYTVDYIIRDTSGQHGDSAPFTVTYSAVPEPASVVLIGSAIGLLALARRRRAA